MSDIGCYTYLQVGGAFIILQPSEGNSDTEYNTDTVIQYRLYLISVANSVYSAYMVENMPYGIVLYKEYRYCMMPYYGIKVWPYIVDMVDTASVNHVFYFPSFAILRG
jgi:hypothetical protein